MFTKLGFAFFRLISLGAGERGERGYIVARLREARRAMAVFATAP